MIRKLGCTALALGLFLASAAAGPQEKPSDAVSQKSGKDAAIGRSYRVPYRLTDTNHFLVRVRLNGKGPFNFLVDSGAPALYVATETAAKIGLKAAENGFWTPLESLEIEGGDRLEKLKARVEDPFQLVGMNALGLPAASIDGILGFTILARFRLEIDPTQDRMTWTRLNFNPADPPVPNREAGEQPPAEMQLMNALGPIAKGLAFLIGKQPEEELSARGFVGLEWVEKKAEGESGPTVVEVVRVLPDSPALRTGVEPGDRLSRINGKSVDGLTTARSLLAKVHPDDSVELVVQRKTAQELTLKLTAGEGL